jgi:hypothetical protein
VGEALALASCAWCREIAWLVRAIAGLAIMAALISAADRKLLVIRLLHGHEKPIARGSPRLRVELPEAPQIGEPQGTTR